MDIIDKYPEKIKGKFEAFDRMIFKGHLRFFFSKENMSYFLYKEGILLKEYSNYVQLLTKEIEEQAKSLAEVNGRPYEYLYSSRISKEGRARKIMEDDRIKEGLICVFATVEPCKTFTVRKDRELKKLVLDYQRRKCRYFYYYFYDRELGFMHIRVQSWLPFEIQIYINGREYIARQLEKRGIAFERYDNTFISIENMNAAQRIADRMQTRKWEPMFNHLARMVNPVMGRVRKVFGNGYYWCLDQCEYATDIMFESREYLEKIYPDLIEYARTCMSCDDIMIFLGRKGLHGGFKGEMITDIKRRPQGVRIKHRVKGNSIKMYDKYSNLRVETTITQPGEFKIYRQVMRKGTKEWRWVPMGKSIVNLYRYAEVSKTANNRYLKALSSVKDTSEVIRELEKICDPIEKKGRHYAGLNLLSRETEKIFSAVMNGQNLLKGFCNKDIYKMLYPNISAEEKKMYSRRITRLFAKLRAFGLIKKIRSSFRYHLTEKGCRIMSIALILKSGEQVSQMPICI